MAGCQGVSPRPEVRNELGAVVRNIPERLRVQLHGEMGRCQCAQEVPGVEGLAEGERTATRERALEKARRCFHHNGRRHGIDVLPMRLRAARPRRAPQRYDLHREPLCGPAPAEFAENDHPARQVARSHMEALRARLAAIARRIGAARPDELGAQLAVLVNGAFVSSGLLAPEEAVDTLVAAGRALCQAAPRTRNDQKPMT
jgi:hypothetical protein